MKIRRILQDPRVQLPSHVLHVSRGEVSVPLRHLERLVAEQLPWKVTLAVPMILSSEAGSPGPGVLRVERVLSPA